MNNKKRIVIGVLIVTFSISIISVKPLAKLVSDVKMQSLDDYKEKKIKEKELVKKKKYITFLKSHEKELTDYIKENTSKNEDVIIHWDTTTETIYESFNGKSLTVRFDIWNSSMPAFDGKGYNLSINTDLNRLQSIDYIQVMDDLAGIRYGEYKIPKISDKKEIELEFPKKMDKTTRKQIEFLIDHEEQMTYYMKRVDSMVHTAAFNWLQVLTDIEQYTDDRNNSLQDPVLKEKKRIVVEGYANEDPINFFRLDFDLNDKNMPVIETIRYGMEVTWDGDPTPRRYREK